MISAGKVVLIDYVLKNDAGAIIDQNPKGEPLAYLHGHANIVEGLEEALEGKKLGDAIDITVPPEKGYGTYDAARVLQVPVERFPSDIKPEVGMMLELTDDQGNGLPCRITKIGALAVELDANHELAGENLHFHVEISEVRDATAEELAHGHVHGAHGHHH